MIRHQAILSEIRQITSQYKAEVPGKRKTWPIAVKDRVKQLLQLGLNPKEISDQSGVSYFTVLNWRRILHQSEGEFKEISTVTVAAPEPQASQSHVSTPRAAVATVTVTTPHGFRIEGMSFEQMMSIFERLK